MPIYKTPAIELTDPRQVATEATLGEAFGAGTYTMYEGLLGATGRREELNFAEGDFHNVVGGEFNVRRDLAKLKPLSTILDPETARQQLRDNGLEQNLSIPDTGIRQATLDILMSRKRDELRRQQIMAESSGLSGFGANITGALVGSLVDPTNIALAFVPVVGEAKYGQMLARAGSAWGRTGVRAGVGGLEGLVGLAPVEVLNYYAHQQQQSDYDAYDSMLAIAGGAGFGSALHGGAGLFSDFVMGGAKRFNAPGRVEPTLDGVTVPTITGPRVVSRAEAERMMVLDRLAEGRPVTRAQVEASMPRTGAEAGQIIDDTLAELRQAAGTGKLAPEQVKALVAESDELAEVLRIQERAERDGTILSPGSRLTPEERAIADTRRQEIKAELERHGAAPSAEKRLETLESKLAKIDSDADLIRLTEELNPTARDLEFVESLSPEVRARIEADPFMPVRPFIASLGQETQASSLRMAVAQAVSGRPIDVSPALYADAAYFSPESAFAAANRNAGLTDVASEAASREGASVKIDDGDVAELKETFEYEADLVARLEKDAGIEPDEASVKMLAQIDTELKTNIAAAKQAAACLMRIGG